MNAEQLPPPVVKAQDMSEEMIQAALQVANEAIFEIPYDKEKEIAGYIKKKFDEKYSPAWHCVVGRAFGSFVTADSGCFLYFYVGKVAVLLFKSA